MRTVRFHGGQAAGWAALEVALTHALPVHDLRRYWAVLDGEPTGPKWEITFRQPAKPLLDEEVKEPPPSRAWICGAHAPSDR